LDGGGSQSQSGNGGTGALVTSEIALWLSDHLRNLSLSEEAEGYLLGRGATPEAIEHFRFVEWVPANTTAPDPLFRERYGNRGERWTGRLVYPLLSPSGGLIGVEARSMAEKAISEFRTPEARWNPVMVNAPEAARKMWEGGSVWVTEGIFDLLPMRMIVPDTDVVIATLTARLSRSHLDFLTRFLQNQVYMVYDNDATGRKATLGWEDEKTGKKHPGALTLLRKSGLRATDYRYRGKDPGEVWSAGGIRNMRRVFLGEAA